MKANTIADNNSLLLHATPYIHYPNFTGFYFKTLDEYAEKATAAYKNHNCEEFEIQFIEGDEDTLQLSKITNVLTNLEEFFELVEWQETATESETIGFHFLLSHGYDVQKAQNKADEVQVYHGSLEDYAFELVEDCYDLPEFAARYFDYEKFARDLELGGDVSEYDREIYITNACGF